MLTIFEKILISALVCIVIVNIAFQIYIRFPDDEMEEENILTVFYGDKKWGYTLSELQGIDECSGIGSMMTQFTIKGPYNFTGVRFNELLHGLDIDKGTMGAWIIAADGYNKTFTSDELQGNISVFDESGNNSSILVELLLVYNQDGDVLNSDDGPLRLAYVGQSNCVTLASYWIKQVREIIFFKER